MSLYFAGGGSDHPPFCFLRSAISTVEPGLAWSLGAADFPGPGAPVAGAGFRLTRGFARGRGLIGRKGLAFGGRGARSPLVLLGGELLMAAGTNRKRTAQL